MKAGTDFAQVYTDFLLGRVIKCRDIDELRQQTVGITPGCMLYKSYKLQHINPENYTERASIGENSLRKRRKRLEEKLEKLEKQRVPLEERQEEIRSVPCHGLSGPPRRRVLEHDKGYPDDRARRKKKEKCCRARYRSSRRRM